MTDHHNTHWLARRQAATARGIAVAQPFFADRALNAEPWDVEGRRYIDFASGIAVLNTGHRQPRLPPSSMPSTTRPTKNLSVNKE